MTGEYNTLDIAITEEEYSRIQNRYENDEKIQNIIPHISAPEREFLMTGTTPKEWEEMFKYEEEDEETEPWSPPQEYPAF